jgi:hypothetical protein
MRSIFKVLMASVLLLAGCGGKASNPIGPSERELGPTVQTMNNTAPGRGYYRYDINVFKNATMTATLHWSSGQKDLDLYLTNGNCELGTTNCTVLAKSELFNGTQEQVVSPVSGGQNYRLWVLNNATVQEGFNLEIVLR